MFIFPFSISKYSEDVEESNLDGMHVVLNKEVERDNALTSRCG